MKKYFALAVAAFTIVAFAGVGLAQTGPAQKPAQPAPQKTAKAKSLTGLVVSVDEKAQTLTVKEEGAKQAERTFALEKKAAGKLSDLKAGDQIRVGYTEAEGKSIANSIKVLRKAKPSA